MIHCYVAFLHGINPSKSVVKFVANFANINHDDYPDYEIFYIIKINDFEFDNKDIYDRAEEIERKRGYKSLLTREQKCNRYELIIKEMMKKSRLQKEIISERSYLFGLNAVCEMQKKIKERDKRRWKIHKKYFNFIRKYQKEITS